MNGVGVCMYSFLLHCVSVQRSCARRVWECSETNRSRKVSWRRSRPVKKADWSGRSWSA